MIRQETGVVAQQTSGLTIKLVLFIKTNRLITKESLKSFSARDIATSLHRIATMLASDLESEEAPSEQVHALFTELTKPQKRREAEPQAIANSLWAIAKLMDLDKINEVNSLEVNELLTEFHAKRKQAKPQAIANSLWAVAKLIELSKINEVNASEVNDLLTEFHAKREQAKPQELANSLWAVAKLIEFGKIKKVNPLEVTDLLNELHAKRKQAKPQEFANSLWAVGVIYTVNPKVKTFEVLDAVIKEILKLESNLNKVEKTQVINALGLLGLDKHYPVSSWITQCRPSSNLTDNQITSYLQRKGLSNHPYTVEKEAFVCGFFVDVLITFNTGDQVIIEFDGSHHNTLAQKRFDTFRDGVLTSRGYTVYRDGYAPVALSANAANRPSKPPGEDKFKTASLPNPVRQTRLTSSTGQHVGFFHSSQSDVEGKKTQSTKESYTTLSWWEPGKQTFVDIRYPLERTNPEQKLQKIELGPK